MLKAIAFAAIIAGIFALMTQDWTSRTTIVHKNSSIVIDDIRKEITPKTFEVEI